MPETPLLPDDDDDIAAAELVLGLTDAGDRARLVGRAERDAGFAGRVEAWNRRLTPLYHELPADDAAPDIWPAIERRIGGGSGQVPDDMLRRRLRRWKMASAGLGALAAALAVALLLPDRAPPPREAQAPVVVTAPRPDLAVAQLSAEDGTPLLAVGVDRRSGEVNVRIQDLSVGARVPELWIIPPGGTPRSLGLIRPDGTLGAAITPELRRAIGARATLAVSLEEPEGAPHATPAGPIVATGAVVLL